MTKRWSEIKDRHPISDEARAAAHLENLAEDFGVALSHLRRGEELTQVEVAHRLLVTQPTVSEIERSGSPSVPTVRRYVEALGARLELVAVFDDGRRVSLDPNDAQSPKRSAFSERIVAVSTAGQNLKPSSTTPRKVTRMSGKKSGRTGREAAAAAARTLGSGSATKSARSAAGSALSQSKSSSVTSKKAARAAATTLASKSAGKGAKSAAGSALSQRPSKRGK